MMERMGRGLMWEGPFGRGFKRGIREKWKFSLLFEEVMAIKGETRYLGF